MLDLRDAQKIDPKNDAVKGEIARIASLQEKGKARAQPVSPVIRQEMSSTNITSFREPLLMYLPRHFRQTELLKGVGCRSK